MRQPDPKNHFDFEVNGGEVITIVFTPIGVGPFVDIAVDGESLPNTGGATPTFMFSVTKSVGQTHFGHIRCDFPTGTGNDAKYKSKISGSLGGSFDGPTVLKDHPSGEFSLKWDVIAAQ